jgi:hypothetical protein
MKRAMRSAFFSRSGLTLISVNLVLSACGGGSQGSAPPSVHSIIPNSPTATSSPGSGSSAPTATSVYRVLCEVTGGTDYRDLSAEQLEKVAEAAIKITPWENVQPHKYGDEDASSEWYTRTPDQWAEIKKRAVLADVNCEEQGCLMRDGHLGPHEGYTFVYDLTGRSNYTATGQWPRKPLAPGERDYYAIEDWRYYED